MLLYAGTALLVTALYVLVWQTPARKTLETLPLPPVPDLTQPGLFVPTT